MKKKKKEKESKVFKWTWRYLDRGHYENNLLLSDGTIKNIEDGDSALPRPHIITDATK